MKEWHRSKNVWEAAGFALRGCREVFVREQNVRIQCVVGILVLCVMFFLRVPIVHIAIFILAILFIITLEMINTSLEFFADVVHPEFSEGVRNAKDIAAGAVLCASIGACIVGLLLLAPVIFKLY